MIPSTLSFGMEPLRRSSRQTKKVNYGDTITPSYPENRPTNDFERRIALLNKQTFLSSSFSAVDDILVYSLFSSKRRTAGYRTMIPDRAFRDPRPLINKEQGLTIRHIYKDCVGEQGKGLEKSLEAASVSIVKALPDFLGKDELPILLQYVDGDLRIFFLLMRFSLLTRYDFLYSEESPVHLDKVSFDGNAISVGLKARVKIPASCPILSTSSSMSSDIIPENLHSVSVIMSAHDQKGPVGPRLILGPLRFANHDCDPNTQVSHIIDWIRPYLINLDYKSQFKSVKNTHAYLLWSIKDIDQGDPITVKYTVDSSYFPDGCRCKTCNPNNPPEAPRRLVVEENFEVNQGKKRVRRGGRRRKAKRQRVEECK
jgi:hypothetical protein